MAKKFGELSVDEQADVAQKVNGLLKEHQIDTEVMIYREEVCQLTGAEVMGRTLLRCEKTLPSTKAAQVDAFKAAAKEYIDMEGVSISISSTISAGDNYKTIIGVTTLDDDKNPVNIEHTEGTVMMIDFWATWCPPCQRPMQHNQDMLDQHKEAWGDRVKIIGLSIDSNTKTVKDHITNKGWTSPIHYWKSKSDCSEVYQVKGVPHILIVDTKGKIQYKGHPASRKDLVADFNALLEGKDLEGVEAPKAGGDDKEGEKAGDAAGTLEQIKATMDEMTKFRDVGTQLQASCKEDATGMIRNFCVLTCEAKLNAAGNWAIEYTNHRVLVGK